MSALAKIKKAAAQHEQDRHYDKALAQYARLLDGAADADEDVDVTLYNRAGDLALRAGDVPRAVTYFERAIDLYAAGGFLNNAVALAVKILRHAPGHLAAHHTLGVLYGRKGFRAEARQHLADYAAQMHRAGRADEVRRTLGELAALGSGADEVAAVGELLTARAATPDDAGALVKAFAAAVGVQEPRAAADAAPAAGIPLSELIEFEIRGPRLAPVSADAASAAVRWLTALPGDPAPLRVSTLRRTAPPRELEFSSFAPPAPVGADEGSSQLALLDLTGFEPTPDAPTRADAFDPTGFALGDGDPHAPAHESRDFAATVLATSGFEVGGFDVGGIDVPMFDAPVTPTSPLTGPTRAAPLFDAPEIDMVPVGAELPAEVESPHFDLLEPEAAQLATRTTDDETAALGVVMLDVEPATTTPAPAPAYVAPERDAPTDLGEWLRSTELPASTRLVTQAPRETGDEDADFDAALHAFTSGLAQAVDAGDRESHYDLGVAFREMGLLTDAVREFQRALAAPGSGLREREALAQCFLDLNRPELALATLEPAADAAAAAGVPPETLVGVHYVLAEAARAVGRVDVARAWYVRVLATDYGFRDAATHLAALPPPIQRAPSR